MIVNLDAVLHGGAEWRDGAHFPSLQVLDMSSTSVDGQLADFAASFPVLQHLDLNSSTVGYSAGLNLPSGELRLHAAHSLRAAPCCLWNTDLWRIVRQPKPHGYAIVTSGWSQARTAPCSML